MCLEFHEASGHAVHAGLEKQIDARFHPVNTGVVQHARFIALSSGCESDFVLRDEVWAMHIPGAEKGGAAEFEVFLFYINDARRDGTKHPFVGVGTEEIDMLYAKRESAEGLDGIEGKKDSARVKQI